MKISIITLGCKVNQYESEVLLKMLEDMGNEVSVGFDTSDVYIINTCAVTNEAERKSRQLVNRCINLNDKAKIIVCGCASQHNPQKFNSNDRITYITGTSYKNLIVEYINKNMGVQIYNIPKEYENNISPKQVRTRVFVKIQDGCNRFCSYCIIPFLRGRSRSREIEDVVKECEDLSSISKEIVLTGIDISSYGNDLNTNISNLILQLKHLNVRIRLGSLETSIITEDFLKACSKLKAFCPQFHLSLQSGSDSVLKKMNRKYTTDEFLEKVRMIYKFFPNATITTDIICGFPTETEEEFNESLEFVRKVGFMQAHVFGYSKRDGTKAAKMKQIPPEIIKDRVARMEDVANEVKNKVLNDYINIEQEVLFENKDQDGLYQGHSRNFIKYYKQNSKNDRIELIKGKRIYKDGLLAED